MTIRCGIIDDEPLGRQIIREYLQKHPDVQIVIDNGKPQEALELIEQHKPDLLFLDIQMPEINGFELLGLIPHKPVVIFCTAYDQYAIAAFEANAVDYLLKPFNQKRFDQALEKARQYLENQQQLPRLNKLLSYLQAERQTVLERLAVRKGNHFKIIQVSDIYWLEALDDYVRIHIQKDKFLVLQRLGDLERQLDSRHFVRIHRSSIVNLDAVAQIHPWSSGRYLLKLKNGVELETSKSGAKVIKGMVL